MKLKTQLIWILLFSFVYSLAIAQSVGISTNAATPNTNAMLDIVSPSSGAGKGLLIPRITYAQRTTAGQSGGLLDVSGNLNGGAAQGLVVYQTNSSGEGEGFYYNTSTTSTPNWVYMTNYQQNPERDNFYLVKSLSDFPTPVNGVITLSDEACYELNGSVNIGTNRIVMGELTKISGHYRALDKLIYTGSGSFISASNKNFIISNITLTASTSGSKVFDVSGSTYLAHILENMFVNCNDIGVFDGGEFVFVKDNYITGCYDGFEFKGTFNHVFFNNNVAEYNNGGVIYRMTSGTFNCCELVTNYIKTTSNDTAIYISNTGLSISAGLALGNFIPGNGGKLTGITTAHDNWSVISNAGVIDADAYGFCRFWANSTSTIISATYPTYYKVSGTNDTAYGERFDFSVNNRLTYTATKTFTSKFVLNGNVEASSPNENIRIAVFKNGTTKIEEVEIRTMNANQPYAMGLNGSVSLSTNDYLEIWVSNITSTANVKINDFQFRVQK